MKNRIFRCIALFAMVVLFVTCAGLIMPDKVSITTDSDEIVAEKTLIPCGTSVGIQMNVDGVLVVGSTKESNAKIGDMIISVNGKAVSSPEQVISIIKASNQSVKVKAIRDEKTVTYSLKPYYDKEENVYRLGLWIKEKIAGIGTMTYYDPETNRFACLGHGIYEPETGALLKVENGRLLNTKVNHIKAGREGNPGEIGGTIFNFSHPLGTLKENKVTGVFADGDDVNVESFGTPVAIGTKDQVEEGEAQILTTIEGTSPEFFDVEITKVERFGKGEIKNMVVKVTDEKLLEKCGGIVQGMSGSPIIQKGRLIGAITHVFVNDPTKGYGIFIENMLDE